LELAVIRGILISRSSDQTLFAVLSFWRSRRCHENFHVAIANAKIIAATQMRVMAKDRGVFGKGRTSSLMLNSAITIAKGVSIA